ncbi:MAG: PP2C family protein-serine/threonine phosphatase [Planctomycetota bacterium]|nr:PP2C family protein-serine/threonine phosphatase [Planctomycetota bacterium]
MAIRVKCPHCRHLLTVPDEYYGRPVRCSVCKNKFRPSGGDSASRPGTGTHKIPVTKPPTPVVVRKPVISFSSGTRGAGSPVPASVRRQRNKAMLDAISEQRKQRSAIEADMGRAARIQFNLLPERIPNLRGFDIRVHYQSAKEVSGDYYDFIPIDRENMGIVVADVSGKGVPGAMVMAMARVALQLLARGNPVARETVISLNRVLSRDIKGVMFVTLMYLVLNVHTLTIQVVNAGHNPLILWRDGVSRLINPKGIAVGLDLGPIFEANLKEDLIQLQKGDRIVVYTDGVVEAMNEKGEEFGEERFLEIVEENADKPSSEFINQLISALRVHQGKAEQHDDITVVTFKYV